MATSGVLFLRRNFGFLQHLRGASKVRFSSEAFNKPKSGNELTRAGGISSLFRLPIQEGQPEGLDACFVGIPMDTGCNYRSGARHGPRAVRHESALIRYMSVTGALPFESLKVADIGDVPIVPYNLQKSMQIITDYYHRIMDANCVPLTMGGDHSLSYPILRAIRKKHGAVGLIQIDAHPDFYDTLSGEKYANGTAFRRVLEEGLVDPKHMVQVGLRGSVEKGDVEMQLEWGQKQGVKQVFAKQCWHKSLAPLMENIRSQFGDIPTYFTFDMDAIDPTNCPGAGSLEVAGLTPIQAMEIVQGLRGLNLVGGDIAETNPLNDPCGITSLMVANLMFEMLCALPGVKYAEVESYCNTDLINY